MDIPQLLLCCSRYCINFSLNNDRADFTFDQTVHGSCGIFDGRITLPDNSFLQIPLSVAYIDVQLLIGLGILQKHYQSLDYDEKVLRSIRPKLESPYTFVNHLS